MALLELQDLVKSFDGPEGAGSVAVLSGLSLDVEEGESVAVVGPSGSGKSTLLNLIGTLEKPDAGSVVFNGKDLTTLDDQGAAAFRNRQIGFVFQMHHLLPQCTVLENILLPTLPAGIDAGERAEELLDRVGLKDRMHHRPGQLSGGECQRAAFVRSLINEPKLLLADEPTGALDHETAAMLTDLLKELNKEQGVSMVLVTHALDLAEKMDRTLSLKDGKLV